MLRWQLVCEKVASWLNGGEFRVLLFEHWIALTLLFRYIIYILILIYFDLIYIPGFQFSIKIYLKKMIICFNI